VIFCDLGTPSKHKGPQIYGSDGELSYEEVMAIATGNPLLLESFKINTEVARLQSPAAQHTRTQQRIRREIADHTRQAHQADRHVEDSPDVEMPEVDLPLVSMSSS
jgi:hypothetical protein